MQGVRQLAPSEVLASAPGGSDSIVSETFAPLERPDMLGMKSKLGPELQPVSNNALATAHTRTTGVITTASPTDPRPSPRRNHTSPPFPAQYSVHRESGGAKAANAAKPLTAQIL
jgi:hypothetical protein